MVTSASGLVRGWKTALAKFILLAPSEIVKMKIKPAHLLAPLFFLALIAGCGSLEKKSALINIGDDKQQVLSVMGAPDDRQVKGSREVWQYCQTGAGFGYHDYRAFSFDQGKVAAIDSYKSGRPGSSCMTDIRQVNWGDTPDKVIEVRHK